MKTKLLTGILFASFLFLSNQVNAQETDSVQVNWSEYYPLHVGDFWVYNRTYFYTGGFQEGFTIKSVDRDTIMADGHKYFLIAGTYQRLNDSTGGIYYWSGDSSYCTFSLHFDGALPCNDTLKFNQWDLYVYTYLKNIGLITYEGYLGYGSEYLKLKGAYINGVVYGDTSYSVIGIKEEKNFETVTDYALNQNYPNPFNPTTNISFQLPKESFVSLVVYNLLGEKVETLVNEYRKMGKHTVTFNAQNLPSGVYLYRLQANSNTFTKKMMLVK